MISYSIDPQIKHRKMEDLLVAPPKVITVNAFTEDSAKTFRKEFAEALQTGQQIVPIEIDSFGGGVYSLLSMVDVIKLSPVPVATIVTGKAMSCGSILFSCGTHGMRVIRPSATVLIHDVGSFAWGKVEEIKADAAEADRLNQFIFKLMAKNCGKKEDYFLDLVHDKGHADWYLTPEDCVKHGLANKIGDFGIKLTVTTKFEVI